MAQLVEGTNYVALTTYSTNPVRAWIEVSTNAAGNYSDVTIRDIQFRYTTLTPADVWRANGKIYVCDEALDYIEVEGTSEIVWYEPSTYYLRFDYSNETFHCSERDVWVSLGYGKYGSFRISHDASGKASFFITPIGSSNNWYQITDVTGGGAQSKELRNIYIGALQLPDIDQAAPTITATVSVTDLGVATLTGTADVSCGSWQYQVDGGSWQGISGTGTSKSVTINGMTGTHTFRMKATKTSNGKEGLSSTISNTTDTSAPTITASASINSSAQVTLTATADTSCSGWAYQIDGGSWNSASGTASSKTFTIPGMTGAHSFRVKATKVSNNQEGTSASVSTTCPTLSLNKTAVSTDSTLQVTVGYLPANTAVVAKYGNTTLKTNSYSSAQTSVTITYSSSDLQTMFQTAGVTTQQSITVTVQVTGYSYTAQSFTLSSGSNMNPTVGTPTATIVQGPTVDSSLASVYIAGISKAKIAAEVSAGSGSSISTVRLTYGNNSQTMSYNSSTQKYEATTSNPITGNTTFTVTATDTRGLTGSSTVSLTGVKSWTEPAITIDTSKTYRCNSSGTKTEGGAYVRAKVTFNYTTGISGNGVRDLYFYVKEEGERTDWTLTSGTQSAAKPLTNPRPNETITVVVKGRDKVGGYVTRELQLSGAHRDFAMANYQSSNAGRRVTALGIGMTPDTSTAALTYGDTVQMPADGRFTVGGKEIQNFIGANIRREVTGDDPWGKDMLAFEPTNPMAEDNETAEFYISNPRTSSWTNLPSTVASHTTAFEGMRLVLFGYNTVFIVLLEQAPIAGRIWINTKRKSSSSTAWNGWVGHTPDIF